MEESDNDVFDGEMRNMLQWMDLAFAFPLILVKSKIDTVADGKIKDKKVLHIISSSDRFAHLRMDTSMSYCLYPMGLMGCFISNDGTKITPMHNLEN